MGNKFTKQYYDCLASAQAHHASSKTYSGKLFRPHAKHVKGIIERLGCLSALDYGCGKGSQYNWVSHGGDASVPAGMTIEQYWGFEVKKYDPAWPPYAARPDGKFDLVVCTHTLGAIPVSDVDAVVEELFEFTEKALYVAEKIGPVQKQVYGDTEMPHGWQREDWERILRKHKRTGIEVTLATRVNGDNGTIVTREVI